MAKHDHLATKSKKQKKNNFLRLFRHLGRNFGDKRGRGEFGREREREREGLQTMSEIMRERHREREAWTEI